MPDTCRTHVSRILPRSNACGDRSSIYARNKPECVSILHIRGIYFFVFIEFSTTELWVRIVSNLNENKVGLAKCGIKVVNYNIEYIKQTISKRGTDYDWESCFKWPARNLLLQTITEKVEELYQSCELTIEIQYT